MRSDHDHADVLKELWVGDWPAFPSEEIYDALLRAYILLEDPLHQHHGEAL